MCIRDSRFEVRTADTIAELDSALVVTFTDPPRSPPVDIGELLVSNSLPNYLQYLRITIVLTSRSGSATPVLHDFTLEYICVPTE